MSNLLQYRHNLKSYFFVLFILFLIIFFSEFVFGFSFGVSPASLRMNGGCEELIVYGDEINVTIYDKWSLKESRDLRDYILNSEDLGVVLRYPEEIYVEDEKEIKVCVDSSVRGYGLLLFSVEGKNAEIGVWINLRGDEGVIGREIGEKSKITGGVIINGELVTAGDGRFYLVLLSISASLLLIFLLCLFWLLKKRKRKSTY